MSALIVTYELEGHVHQAKTKPRDLVEVEVFVPLEFEGKPFADIHGTEQNIVIAYVVAKRTGTYKGTYKKFREALDEVDLQVADPLVVPASLDN